MPGPLWRQTVNQLDRDIERCKYQAERLDQSREEVFQGQVYKNANTIVEVSVKTRKDKGHQDAALRKKSSKEKNLPPSSMRGRKIVTKKFERNQTDSPTWSKALLSSKNTNSVDKKNLNSSKKVFGVFDTVDNVRDDEKVENKGLFKSRTLKVYLKEMRGALAENNVDVSKARAILDDLEFVTFNLQKKDEVLEMNKADEMKIPQTVKNENDLKKKIEELTSEVSTYHQKTQAQDKQINELKSALQRVTGNNEEMVKLLSRNVGINDLAKKLQDENDRLVDSLRKERNSVALLRSGLAMKEKEIKTLKKTIKDIQGSLSRDLQAVRKAPPPPQELNFTQESSKFESSSTDVDSALGEGSCSQPSSRSQQQEESSVKKVEEIISNAKNMFKKSKPSGQTKNNAAPDIAEQEREQKRNNNPKSSEPFSRKPVEQPIADKEVPNHLVAPNVGEFLKRVRNNQAFDITVPELPTVKSFVDVDVDFTTTSGNDFESTIGSLSESKFRQGLEASIQLSSEAE